MKSKNYNMRRYISVILSLCFLFSIAPMNVVAFNKNTEKDLTVFNDDELRVYNKRIENVRKQLKKQGVVDPVMIKLYEDTVYADTLSFFNKESAMGSRADSYYGFYAPGGGLLTFTYDVNEEPYIGSVMHHMNRDDSYTYLLDALIPDQRVWTYVIGDTISHLLGYLPYGGIISSVLFTADTIVDDDILRDIRDADGYIMVQNSNFIGSSGCTSVMSGWASHDIMKVASHVGNLTVTYYNE